MPGPNSCQQAGTGDVLSSINPSVVLPLGDTQYDRRHAVGVRQLLRQGEVGHQQRHRRLQERQPADAGNHEYRTAGATGYFGYFGSNAGDPSKGYYSFDIAGPNNAFHWHVIALNSECSQVGGCGVGSPQEKWLKADLAANPNACTIAVLPPAPVLIEQHHARHRPRTSRSGTTSTRPAPTSCSTGTPTSTSVSLPQTSSGAADPTRGLTEFVIGNGGEGFAPLGAGIANSVVRNNTSFGAMKMTLHANSLDYQFVPAAGYSFTDAGSLTCHNAPAPDTAPPSQPTGLQAVAPSADQVSLSWTASTDNVGVTGYKIYRGANGSTPTLLTTTTNNTTSYVDAPVVANTAYDYRVQAIDGAGNCSAQSTVASVTTPATGDSIAPTAPTNLSVDVVDGGQVDLGWSPSTDSGTGISGYRIYRGEAGDPPTTLLASTVGTGRQLPGPHRRGEPDLQVPGGGLRRRRQRVGPVERRHRGHPAGLGDAHLHVRAHRRRHRRRDRSHRQPRQRHRPRGRATARPATPCCSSTSTPPQCTNVSRAELQLTNDGDGSDAGGDIYTTGSGWDESALNWNNAPGPRRAAELTGRRGRRWHLHRRRHQRRHGPER